MATTSRHAAGHQFLVGAALLDAAVVQHHDLIGQ